MEFDRSVLKPVSLTFSAALVLAGCSGIANQLRTQAATDLGCQPQNIVFEEGRGDPLVGTVKGCGKSGVYGFNRTEMRWVSPIERAAFETSCPKEQMTSEQIGAKQAGVKGCGHTLLYVHD